VSFQTVGILAESNLSWSSQSRAVLNVFNFANVDLSVFASECALSSFFVTYAVSVSIPLVVAMSAWIVLITVRFLVIKGVIRYEHMAGLKELSVRTLVESSVFLIAPLLYIPIAKASFKIFDCSRIAGGRYVLDSDFGVACFDGRWWSWAWIGILAVVVYVIGVPAHFLASVVRHRHTLMTQETFRKYGPLYHLYRTPYYWTGVADLMRRLLLVISAVFFSNQPLIQITITFLVMLTACLFLRAHVPYYYELYNKLDFRLTVTLIVLLMMGMGFYAERASSNGADVGFFVGTICAVIALLVVSVWGVVVDVRQIVQSKRQRFSDASVRETMLVTWLERQIPDMNPEVGSHISDLVTLVQSGCGRDGDDGEFATMGAVEMDALPPSFFVSQGFEQVSPLSPEPVREPSVSSSSSSCTS